MTRRTRRTPEPRVVVLDDHSTRPTTDRLRTSVRRGELPPGHVPRTTSASRSPAATTPPVRHRPAGLARGRLLLLLGGGIGLFVGMWTGLSRVDLVHAGGPVAHHGVIMVLGFLGTLIALERAVARGAGWAYVAPSLSGAAVLWLLLGGAAAAAGVALAVAAAVVLAVYGLNLRTQPEPFMVLMALGGVAWLVAAVAWTAGSGPVRITPLLAAFLVLTIVGERLELSRLRFPSPAAVRRLLVAAGVFGAGCLLALVDQRAGLVTGGVGLAAQTAWLVRNDIARVTIRRAGLPRFAAACMLAGYVWLGVSGVLWIALGLGLGGPLLRDAALHSLFLGFVISMVMGHAPIILPAVLRIPLPHRRAAWIPLVVLHVSVTFRVAVDLAGSGAGRTLSAHGNVAALVLFVAIAVVTARRAVVAQRRDAAAPARSVPPATAGGPDPGERPWRS